MAKNPLFKINFATDSNLPYVANDELIVYFDDANFFPYHTLNGVQLIDPTYDINLSQPFTKDAEDNVTTEYKVSFLDSNFAVVGGLQLNYVKPIPTTPNQDDSHIGQPVLPPPSLPPQPPQTPVVIPDPTGQTRNPSNTIPGKPRDLQYN